MAVPGHAMTRRRVLDDDEAAAVTRRYIAGETIDELAAAFGCSIQPIRRILTEAKVPIRRRSHRGADVDVDELVRLYEAGGILDDLGVLFGVHRNTVRRRLMQAGVQLRPRGAGISLGMQRRTERDAAKAPPAVGRLGAQALDRHRPLGS
jgi:hypothetical protein